MTVTVRAPARPLILALIAAMAIAALPAGSAVGFTQNPATVWINEIHYDNTGTDAGEAIEVAGPAGTDLTGWSIVLYNGTVPTAAVVYDTDALTGTIPDQQNGFGTVFLSYPVNGIQNGPTDGVALVNGTTLVQFLSYEGSITGSGGAANGIQSTDIGVSQSGSGATGQSLRLSGTGSTYQAFSWNAEAPSTFGSPNTGQTLQGATDAAPSVASSTPVDGASDVAPNASLSVTFSESVSLADAAILLSCNGTGVPAIVAAGPATTFAIEYVPPLPDGASCVITVNDTGVSDTDAIDPPNNMTADVSIDFTVIASDPCAGAFTPIPTIQGVDDTADVTGTVTTEGVVVSDDEGPAPTLRGFYVQDPAGDGNPATSDGIFVFNGNANTVENGDNVRVTGTASEFQGQTQISATSIVDCDTTDTVVPTDIAFPVASPTALEAYEGMLIRVPEVLTVTEHFQLGRFGQVTLSSEGRLDNPTAVAEPGAPAVALQLANNLRKIILDDSLQSQNPDPIRFGRGGDPLSASNTLRGGDTVTNLTGVMTYTWAGNAASGNAYRIRPLNALGGGDVDFQPTNVRPGPTVEIAGENVRVAGLNLLNYFNTFDGLPDPAGNDNCDFGVGGLPADCRGADTQAEFDRQWPKTVAAILGLDADVIGINEIENDGYGPDSAIVHLVDRLNAEAGAGTYAFIDVDAETGQINAAGTDAIKVGILYRPAAVTPVGTTGALNSEAFVNGGDAFPRSRPSIAQAFETVDGARFIVDVNHFKSKGSACTAPDAGDGQGNCNVVRRNAAIALSDWLASDPTGTGDSDVLIVGDLNSYAKEDPVDILIAAGFTDLVDAFVEGTPYSYVFDAQWGYLDYALGTASVAAQVAGIVEWHIDSDEPSVLDYNTDFKTANLQNTLYAADRFRVSDHDPIVVGLDADSDRPVVDAGGPYTVEEADTTELTASGSDPTGDDVSYAWDLDGDGSFETPGATVTFSAGALQAPHTVTVTVRITDEHGQSSTDTADIDVIWDFGGFKAPTIPGVTTIKAGGSHPVKFSLDGPQGPAILDGSPSFQREDCATHGAIGSAIPAASNEPLAYDAATDTYKYTWKTQKAWVGWCGTFSLHLADGQTYDFEVRFKS